jgi:UDPglucose 6-dehydrogenase
VIGADSDANKVEMVNQRKSPIFEPGLQDLLARVVRRGSLRCVTQTEKAVIGSDITFVSVGTPSLRSGGIDLKFVRAAAKDIGRALREKSGYHLVVITSTVTPGTTESIVQPIVEEHSGKRLGEHLGFCMNPEFLREGNAIHDVFHPHLVVIGECDRRSGDQLERFYQTFFDEKIPLMRVNPKTAELIKYANNAFLATKISFVNTIANICGKLPDVDVVTVAKAIGSDPRIGPHFLKAGVGFGGSCLPKDLRALINFARKHCYGAALLKAVSEVNEDQWRRVYELARSKLGGLKGKRIAVLGLAFKPGTDDVRESPSIRLVRELVKARADVVAYDPAAMCNARRIVPRIRYEDSPRKCLEKADCAIVATEWEEFMGLTPEDFSSRMRYPLVIDGRRVYDSREYSKVLDFVAVGLCSDESNCKLDVLR